MTERLRADVLMIGAGAAGLYTALHLPPGAEVVVVDKGRKGQGSSPWAQGGVAAALGPDDSPDLHAEDTIRVAGGHADRAAVEVLCSEAPECVLELVELGCALDRDDEGNLDLAREGGQSVPRSAHASDATGAAIMRTLRERARDRVRRIEGTAVSLAISDGRCTGAWVLADGEIVEVQSDSTVVATGGLGALFEATTNPAGATGDGMTLCWDAGAGLSDLEFVQFHPTALAVGTGSQRPLLTEALRGAGAYIVDGYGRRFLFEHHSDGELAPRDVVARAISARHAWLDCRHLPRETLRAEFPTVVAVCTAHGLDPSEDLLPITPAAHYAIGGVQTDLDGRTSVPRLYVVGECSSTGVHGANRLPGNSLAEALVFGRRAARAIASQRVGRTKTGAAPPPLPATTEIDGEQAWRHLRALCSGSLSIERAEPSLQACIDELEELALLPLSRDPASLELRSAATIARLMARAAVLRNESRGVHFRSDRPNPVVGWAGVRLRFARG